MEGRRPATDGSVAPARTPEITIVAPTRNEEAIIGAFIDSLDEELPAFTPS